MEAIKNFNLGYKDNDSKELLDQIRKQLENINIKEKDKPSTSNINTISKIGEQFKEDELYMEKT